MYIHEKACYRHSHRVPATGYIACCNRLKLNRLLYPPIAPNKLSGAKKTPSLFRAVVRLASAQSVHVKYVGVIFLILDDNYLLSLCNPLVCWWESMCGQSYGIILEKTTAQPKNFTSNAQKAPNSPIFAYHPAQKWPFQLHICKMW